MDSHWLTRWLAIGANVAVVVGIALLIVELQQNRDMIRAQTRHELAMGIVDLLQVPAGDAQLADVMFRAQTGQALSPVELYQFQLRTNALFRYWEDVHYQYRVGLYDRTEFARQVDAWRSSMARSRLGSAYWCQVRGLYSPDFAAEMDGLLAEPCGTGDFPVNAERLQDFASRYTAAWNSRNPANVAAFFAEDGTLLVNGAPAVGREGIIAVAQGFMSAFPDMELTLDALEVRPGLAIYHWTFAGTNTGPGGTGNAVRFSGYEEWRFGPDDLIVRSDGNFDSAEYQRQLEHGLQ